ncbi:MAG: TonB family protein [Candidatus Dadabacteria bacterium]|nr:MAG: TonB family protein [Candidatus Dadabacteria bacterium]
MTRRTPLGVALAASLVVHGALVALTPGIRWSLPVRERGPVEVELLRPRPEPLRPEPPEPRPEPRRPPEPLEAAEAERVLGRMVLPDLAAAPPVAAPPPIRPPARRAPPPDEPDEIPWVAPPVVPTPEPVPQVPAAAVAVPAPEPAPRARVDELLARVETRAAPEAPKPLEPLEIEWQEGASRRLVEAPPVPAVPVVQPVSVRVKFWVSPRGDVVETLVVQRGAPDLDRIAQQYVARLRFNPLPAGRNAEQWGIVTVRFELE